MSTPLPYRFNPYVGDSYGAYVEHHKNRLLILGESHYGTKEEGDTELTNRVMRDWRDRKRPHTALTKTAKILTQLDTALIRRNRQHFFNGCVFYNYMQDYVGLRHDDFNADFLKHLPLFEQLICTLKPTHILGWGWRLGEGLMQCSQRASSHTKISRDTTIDGYRLMIGDVQCAMMFIPHPSARGNLYAEHAGRVKRLMNSYGGIPQASIFDGGTVSMTPIATNPS